MAFNPNSELVAMTYLRAITEPTLSVGTTLPEDESTWTNGFVQVTVVGGSPDLYVPIRRPLVQVDCWTPSVNGSKPKWSRTNSIAEDIIASLYRDENKQFILELGNYQDALVQEVSVASEPRKITGDPAGHARYTFDISLKWITSENITA